MARLTIAIVLLITVFNTAWADNSLIQGFSPIDVVYHGSPNTDIKIFEPRAEHVRDPKEGSVVFATPSIRFASCYLFRWDDSWVHQSISLGNNKKPDEIYMVISDRKRFEKLDVGGSLYLLPANQFSFNKNKNLGVYEWTSKEKVGVLSKIHFASSLEAMRIFGVMVYFLDKKQFKDYLALSDKGKRTFLKKFEPYNEL